MSVSGESHIKQDRTKGGKKHSHSAGAMDVSEHHQKFPSRGVIGATKTVESFLTEFKITTES